MCGRALSFPYYIAQLLYVVQHWQSELVFNIVKSQSGSQENCKYGRQEMEKYEATLDYFFLTGFAYIWQQIVETNVGVKTFDKLLFATSVLEVGIKQEESVLTIQRKHLEPLGTPCILVGH